MNLKIYAEPFGQAFAILGGTLVVIAVVMFKDSSLLFILLFISLLMIMLPGAIEFFQSLALVRRNENHFLQFVRDFGSTLKSGMIFSKALEHVSVNDYGTLSMHVRRLSNQVQLGISAHVALKNFADSLNSPIISRAISVITEAEKSGGRIDTVIDTVADSLYRIEYVRKKRRSSIQGQIVQSYVIFLVFLALILVIQLMVIPAVRDVSSIDTGLSQIGSSFAQMESVHIDTHNISAFFVSLRAYFGSLDGILIMISVIQATFTGIVLGRLSEGSFVSGLKHSLIMSALAIIIILSGQSFTALAVLLG